MIRHDNTMQILSIEGIPLKTGIAKPHQLAGGNWLGWIILLLNPLELLKRHSRGDKRLHQWYC
jgi:hypothetical protein